MEGSPLRVGCRHLRSGRWQFKAKFYVEERKLGLVQLNLLNGENGCGFLWADMKSVYRKLFSDDDNAITHLAIWQDVAANNRIALFEILQHRLRTAEERRQRGL
jgi:hypothetical protein